MDSIPTVFIDQKFIEITRWFGEHGSREIAAFMGSAGKTTVRMDAPATIGKHKNPVKQYCGQQEAAHGNGCRHYPPRDKAMTTYKNEIKSVFENNICIGFITRRSVIRGCAQAIQNGWMIIEDFSGSSQWRGNYSTRREAVIVLLDMKK